MITTLLNRLLGRGAHTILPHLDNETFLHEIYKSLLMREIDPQGLKDNLAYLSRGNSRLSLVSIILNSDEFNQLGDKFIHEEFQAGSFASAIPGREDIERTRSLNRNPKSIPGIDVRHAQQLELLQAFKPYYDEMPHHQLTEQNRADFRYNWVNPSYSPSDAIATYGMMRHFRPQRIIEVGCGNSSCVMLDTNDRFFEGKIDFTLVEPYPEFLKSVLWPQDVEKISLIPEKVQDVPLEPFLSLEENDILFIDSSHVSKAGSDVNYLYLDILPQIKPGVLVHIHDISYPFEYPQVWLDQGRYWNEQYLLRALLIDNSAFEIQLFTTYMIANEHEWISANMPRFNEAGGSIWLRRTA